MFLASFVTVKESKNESPSDLRNMAAGMMMSPPRLTPNNGWD